MSSVSVNFLVVMLSYVLQAVPFGGTGEVYKDVFGLFLTIIMACEVTIISV